MKTELFDQLSDTFDLPIYLYTERSGGYYTTKFDLKDGDVRGVRAYMTGFQQCTCPSFDWSLHQSGENGCKHLQMLKGKFKDVGASGREVEAHLNTFCERFLDRDFEMPFIPDVVESVTLEVPGDKAFSKVVKKGLRFIAGYRKLDSGRVGILLKFS